jgi:hypothetical protein
LFLVVLNYIYTLNMVTRMGTSLTIPTQITSTREEFERDLINLIVIRLLKRNEPSDRGIFTGTIGLVVQAFFGPEYAHSVASWYFRTMAALSAHPNHREISFTIGKMKSLAELDEYVRTNYS